MKIWVPSLAPLSGLRIWCCRELWCRSQMRLRSRVAVAVVWACSYSSDSTPSLGISICCRCGPKKTKNKQKTVLPWEGTARGFIGFAQKTGLWINVSVLLFIHRSFQSHHSQRQWVQWWFLVVFGVIVPWPSLWSEDCLQGKRVTGCFDYKRKH